MVRLKDIAKRIGCSIQTVSAVVNQRPNYRISDSRRKEIETVANELGYVPDLNARILSGGYSGTIGIIGDSQASSTVQALSYFLNDFARMEGYCCLLNSPEDIHDQKRIVKNFRSRGVDGFLFFSSCEDCDTFGVPSVKLSASGGQGDVFCGWHDVTFEMVTHLAEVHGRKHFLFVGIPAANQAKFSGFKDALAVLGLDLLPEQICDPGLDKYSANTFIKMLTEGKYDAVIAISDFVARHVIEILEYHRIDVPGDVSVVGFGNQSQHRHIHIPLTTAELPLSKLARFGITELMNRIRGKEARAPIYMPANVIYRRSCGCAFDSVAFLEDFSIYNKLEPYR